MWVDHRRSPHLRSPPSRVHMKSRCSFRPERFPSGAPSFRSAFGPDRFPLGAHSVRTLRPEHLRHQDSHGRDMGAGHRYWTWVRNMVSAARCGTAGAWDASTRVCPATGAGGRWVRVVGPGVSKRVWGAAGGARGDTGEGRRDRGLVRPDQVVSDSARAQAGTADRQPGPRWCWVCITAPVGDVIRTTPHHHHPNHPVHPVVARSGFGSGLGRSSTTR